MSTTRERYLQWKNRCATPQLPIEIWSHIFSYLSVNDLFSIRLVCRLFYSCVNQYTQFWSLAIFDLDRCPMSLVPWTSIENIRLSNIDLLIKSNRFARCTVFFRAQTLPSNNAQQKRRQRRLMFSPYEQDSAENDASLRCSSVHFQSLRAFDQMQLESLLKRRIRRLTFSYECLPNEPSMNFLFKLERLKYLHVTFVHNITELDAFATMLINTIRQIVLTLIRLPSLKSLTLHNVYLVQPFPEPNVYAIRRLRSLWLEDCRNIHFLLAVINPEDLKHVILRRSTCERTQFRTFLHRLNNVEYLDVGSLQILQASNQIFESFIIPSTLKQCRLNQNFVQCCSRISHSSVRSFELIDIEMKQLLIIERLFDSFELLCLFFTSVNSSLTPLIDHFRKNRLKSRRIHLHLQSTIDDLPPLPANVIVVPVNNSFHCFRYENLIK